MRRLARPLWPAAMASARSAFPEQNPYGVFAYGIGRRLVRGRLRNYATLQVFVERKVRRPPAPVPDLRLSFEGIEYEVTPDVVAARRGIAATQGSQPYFTGLHAGAAITVEAPDLWTGGVACLIGDDSAPTHLFTAGHLFEEGAAATPVFSAYEPGGEVLEVGCLTRNLLDGAGPAPDAETRDVALVTLSAEGVEMARATCDGPRLERVADHREIHGRLAQCYLPTLAAFYRHPFPVVAWPFEGWMEATPRPRPYRVAGVLQTPFSISVDGDSGTVLCGLTGKEAFGVCIGTFGSGTLFEPLSPIFPSLEAIIGHQARIWRAR